MRRSASELTPREREIAAMVARGLTNRQIDQALVIAEGTAALHVKRVLAKPGFSSRAQVASSSDKVSGWWSATMHDVLDTLNHWKLDPGAVRKQVYRAATPRERERWHALWPLAEG